MTQHEEKEYANYYAETLAEQLSGHSLKMFAIMTGATILAMSYGKARIRLSKDFHYEGGIEYVEYSLNGVGYYDVKFCKVDDNWQEVVIKEFTDLDDLSIKENFETVTGLVTSL